LIPSEMGRDSDAHAGMAPPGARGQKRQVALDVSTQVEKVRDQQDARRPFPDTRFDPRRNVGTGDFEEARFDDAAGEPAAQAAGNLTQQTIGRRHAAAVSDDEERRPPGPSQRAGPRTMARKRRSPSTIMISRPSAASSSRTYPRPRMRSSPGTAAALVSVPIASSPW